MEKSKVWFAAAIVWAVVSVLFLTVGLIRITSPKPEILIVSESFIVDYAGNTILLVDYTVGGIATNATYRENQMEKYYLQMQMLERIGRVTR